MKTEKNKKIRVQCGSAWVQCGSVRVQCGSVGSALACFKAEPTAVKIWRCGDGPQRMFTYE
jgi:hypothetical protein